MRKELKIERAEVLNCSELSRCCTTEVPKHSLSLSLAGHVHGGVHRDGVPLSGCHGHVCGGRGVCAAEAQRLPQQPGASAGILLQRHQEVAGGSHVAGASGLRVHGWSYV